MGPSAFGRQLRTASLIVFYLLMPIATNHIRRHQEQKEATRLQRQRSLWAWDRINKNSNGRRGVVSTNSNSDREFFRIGTVPFEKRRQLGPRVVNEQLVTRQNNPFPVQDFDEKSDRASDPKDSDMDASILLAFLRKNATNFVEDFCSIRRPSLGVEKSWKKRRGDKSAIKRLVKSTFGANVTFPNGLSNPLGHRPNFERKIIRYMYKFSSCPVFYQWKQLNIRFWPRFIRVGQCYSGSKFSCSLPSGMTCEPSTKKEISILRWLCKKGQGYKRQCRWIEMFYPVLTSCKCSI